MVICVIEARLNEIRRRLLDLTRRNRLLNHRSKGPSTLQIVDELPAEVYRVLVDEAHAMQFLSREEAPDEIRHSLPVENPDVGTSGEICGSCSEKSGSSSESDGQMGMPATGNTPIMPANDPHASPKSRNDEPAVQTPTGLPLAPVIGGDSIAERHRDSNLQTPLSGDKLQARLVHLAREATSALEEQGYNILYTTLGMVEWRQANAEMFTSRAPLVFVPVELRRRTVNSRYEVRVFDDDIVTNPCLVELCRSVFHFEFPAFDAEHDELEDYFERVRKAILAMPRWQFLPEIHVGLFSFSKLLMYRDLDPKNWPQPERLTGNGLICRLTGIELGDDNGDGGLPDPNGLDRDVEPSECFQVVDADSSQQAAILAAKRGLSMVIDGPPGTGKSQTITNIIAECLSENRTVLFVSEKLAALEVVQRNLNKAGLGDFVLGLHSRKVSKNALLQEIQRVLDKEATPAPNPPERVARDLETARAQLNDYHRELHTPFGRLGIKPFDGISRAVALSDEPEASCDIPDVAAWTMEQLQNAEAKLETLDRRLKSVGDPTVHPWRGVGLQKVGYQEKQGVRKACDSLSDGIRYLLEVASKLASCLGLAAPCSLRAASEQIDAAQTLLTSSTIGSDVLQNDLWNTLNAPLEAWLDRGLRREELKAVWRPHLKPDAEEHDWEALRERRRTHGKSVFRWFRPSWRADGRRLRSFMLSSQLPSIIAQIALLDALIDSAGLRRDLEGQAATYAPLFGDIWRGPESDWHGLKKYALDAVAVRDLISTKRVDPSSAAKIVGSEGRVELKSAASAAQAALARVNDGWRGWLATIDGTEQEWLGEDWESAELPSVAERLVAMTRQLELLEDWIDFRQTVRECANSPLSTYVDWALGPEGSASRGRMAATFRRHFYHLWVEEAFAQCASLRGFRGRDHEALIKRFCKLDVDWLEMTQHRLVNALNTRRPQGNHPASRQSKLGLLKAECRKKRRHMPLRRLLAEAGEVVQSLKPCFMMSPLSVAQYLSPGGLDFDVVVFDEASQVEEADAYGAVARGRQLVLVGDEKQLPPTDFFSRGEPEDSESEADNGSHIADLGSILSRGIVHLRHRCRLRWHYRSRHSSLIEFSNYRFYQNELRVFPSPHTDRAELGLAFQFVADSIYRRGTGRDNPIEAKTVAEAVMRHALQHPDESLGVGTFNWPQYKLIEDEIERLRRHNADPQIEEFFNRHAAGERFFVKNIENIQGDERDVIFISIGFGKDEAGKPSNNFGAIGWDGGERRLNVLITRARQRCVVFSSIRADEINLGANAPPGVVAFKEYLHFAEHGQLQGASMPRGNHDSDFEASVCRALRNRGWEVHAQVGCAGFSVDLAVVDPRSPGRYLLGIECDGATYHSSPTARDRDRLRQQVLENKGWEIHRIWSTDWFRRPEAALEQSLTKLEQLKASSVRAAPPLVAAAAGKVVEDETPNTRLELPKEQENGQKMPEHVVKAELPEGVVAYSVFRNVIADGTAETLLQLPPVRLMQIVRRITQIEGPIHSEEALRVFAEIHGTKASSRLRDVFDGAVVAALAHNWIARKGDFLWSGSQKDVRVRHRGEGCPVRKPELIAPEEFEAAVKLVLRQQFGLKSDGIVESVTRILGFGRAGAKLRNAIEDAVVRLSTSGEVLVDGAKYVTLRPETQARS